MPRPGRRPGAAESGHPKWSAAFASLLLNAVVAWWWLAPRPQAAAPVEPVLVVDFFPSVIRPRAPSNIFAAADSSAARNRGSAAQAPVVDSDPPSSPPGPGPEPAPTAESAALPASPAGMTAVFVRPGEPWSAAPAAPALADPFRSPHPRLPGADARMFRMRAPPSPARTVARIGVLFGADGKTGCSGIGDEIAGYTRPTDRAALQRAIEYERRHCRP